MNDDSFSSSRCLKYEDFGKGVHSRKVLRGTDRLLQSVRQTNICNGFVVNVGSSYGARVKQIEISLRRWADGLKMVNHLHNARSLFRSYAYPKFYLILV